MEIIYNENEKSLVRLTRFDILKFSKYELLEQCSIEEVKEVEEFLYKYYEDIDFIVIDIEEYVKEIYEINIPITYFDFKEFIYENMMLGFIVVFMYNNKFIYLYIIP